MATTISGSAGVTFPAGGVGNPTSAVVGINDTQTLTNKTLTSPTLTSPTMTGALVSAMASSVITSGTAVTVSTTSVNFTSVIPAWAKRVSVMFSSVSTNGTNPFVIQLGTGGVITTSGYLGTGLSHNTTGIGAAGYTNGLVPIGGAIAAANTYQGICTFINVSGNIWTGTGIVQSTGGSGGFGSTVITLAGVLDSLRVIASGTGNPADTFDAGSINILYE